MDAEPQLTQAEVNKLAARGNARNAMLAAQAEQASLLKPYDKKSSVQHAFNLHTRTAGELSWHLS